MSFEFDAAQAAAVMPQVIPSINEQPLIDPLTVPQIDGEQKESFELLKNEVLEIGKKSNEVPVDRTRYLFFAGDVLPNERKDERTKLLHGGEELSTPCAVRTKGFLPTCFLTPLEIGAQQINEEERFDGAQILGMVARDNQISNVIVGQGNLYLLAMYPGDALLDIMAAGMRGTLRKGIVEITELSKENYDFNSVMTQVQDFFFPRNGAVLPNVPVELRLKRQMIEQAASRTSEKFFHNIASDMIASCDQFRRWATNRLDEEDLQIQERVKHHHVYTYSDVARVLMAQLERQPKDAPFDAVMKALNMQSGQSQPVNNQADLVGLVTQVLEQNKQKDEENRVLRERLDALENKSKTRQKLKEETIGTSL